MSREPIAKQPELVRGLGAWDGVLLTISGIVGTGIFLTTADIARVLPHGGMILLVWIVGGLLTMAGALSYAELGAMYPRAGGIYHFIKEAYGPLWGFFYGWASFWVIMTGGIAAIAVGTGEYLGAFFPFFSTRHLLLSVPLGAYTWTLSGGQLAAALFITVLTAINIIGLREGALVQNALTVVKVGAIGAFLVFGFLLPAKASPDLGAALPGGNLLAAFGVGMIAALWTFDGWYGLTFSAGEMRNPARNVPLGLVGGTAAVTAIYLLLNWVYLRAIPANEMSENPRIAEAAARVLFGDRGAQLLTAAVLVSSLGCLAATILYAARIYLPMAQDGLFFRSLAEVDARYRTPARCLLAQGAWSILLTLSGKYDQLYTYVVFVVTLMHVLTGLAVFVLRRRHPDLPRPYKVWGYPVVPALFVLASAILVANTLRERPVESLWGLVILALGLPAYAYWRRQSRAA
jgi:APA family basic amino acid/polyamine antiporter